MDSNKKGQMNAAEKKQYLKPMVQKHKAAAVVAGSSSSCSLYHASYSGGTYYH